MGRKYVWHTLYGYEVPASSNLDVEGNPNLEWREEPEVKQAPVAAKPTVEPVKPPVRRTTSKTKG